MRFLVLINDTPSGFFNSTVLKSWDEEIFISFVFCSNYGDLKLYVDEKAVEGGIIEEIEKL